MSGGINITQNLVQQEAGHELAQDKRNLLDSRNDIHVKML